MADNVNIKDAANATVAVATDQVTDATLGSVQVQYVKLMDGTLDGTGKAAVGVNGLKVDGSGATQPISASALPLPTGASQDATLTGGSQKAITRGGAKGSTTAADVTSIAVDANTQALHTSVTNFPTTQAVSAASLPLPTGAALEAGNLATLVTNTTGVAKDATLTGGTQQSKITNGTQVADILAGDSGQNSLLQAGTRKEVSFTTTTVQAVATTDVSNYRWVSVHVVSQGTTSTVNFQGSNDNINWVGVTLVTIANAGASVPVTSTTSSAVIVHGPVPFRYFRLSITGITAGTTAGVVEFFSAPAGNFSGQASITGSVTSTPATATTHTLTAAATTNATSVKATAASLYGVMLTNYSAAIKYFKVYNKASAPTVGTDIPLMTIEVAANTSRAMDWGPIGLRLSTGLAIAITGAQADTDTTALAAGDVKSLTTYI